MTIRATYENGVFRPIGRVDLPEPSLVELDVRQIGTTGGARSDGEHAEAPGWDEDLAAIYEILSRRYDSGESDVAARHNEHQP